MTAANARQRGAPLLSTRFVKVDEAARLKVLISVVDTTPATLRRVETLPIEIQIVNRRRKVVQALVPHDSIEQLAAFEGVIRLSPPGPKLHRAGSVTSQGDGLLNADDVRLLGFDGAGVTVAAMSDGVAGLGTSVASGDLPAGTKTSCGIASGVDCSCSMGGGGPTDGAEGTAMLEIIHDLAPGADLAFGNFDTELEFASVIGCLAAPGHVLVDDVIFLAEPVFEDGIVAQAADAAVAAGAVYVSAAGNDAGQHVEGVYTDIDPGTDDTAFTPTGVDFHDFAAGDASLTVSVNPGGSITPTLHWDEEYGASGEDYDLYIYDSAFPGALNILDFGADFQDGTGDPVEIAFFENTSPSPVTVHVVIDEYSATQAKILKLHIFALAASVADTGFLTQEREIYGHAAAAGAIAVGAVPWFDPAMIEPFSSRGPVQLFFPTSELRRKPEIVAPDGVSVTGNGGFPSHFLGTSAAAPHAAAVAALLLDRQPASTPELVRLALTDTAVDLGLPGVDDTFGFGRIDALAAVNGFKCGNGTLDVDEQCDDGNSADGDGCSATCKIEACFTCAGEPSTCVPITSCVDGDDCCPNGCPPLNDDDCATTLPECPSSLSGTCESGFRKGLLIINEKKAGKERFIAKWMKGPELTQTDFGNPLGLGGTAYNICIYNDGGTLAGEYTVDRPGGTCEGRDCWRSIGRPPPDGKGYKYKDKDLTSDGIQLIVMKGGDADKSKALAKGENNSTRDQLALPIGVAAALTGSTSATVQLFGSDAPKCISVTLPTLKDDGVQFKAEK